MLEAKQAEGIQLQNVRAAYHENSSTTARVASDVAPGDLIHLMSQAFRDSLRS